MAQAEMRANEAGQANELGKANEQVNVNQDAVMKMVEMISGFWLSRCIYIAAKLGLADQLKDSAKTAEELAEETKTHAPSLYRVLRALAGVGIFFEDEERRFHLTPLAETLRADAPVSLRAFATSELGEVHYPSWGAMLHTVETGEKAFDHVFGTDVWNYFAKHTDTARTFNQSMTELTRMVLVAVTSAYDFSAFDTIVDVGGGHGQLLTAILKKTPSSRGILFDAPQVVEGAKKSIEAEGLADRCVVWGGSFFETVPEGGDAYVMKHIIHDWDDAQALLILKLIRGVIPEAGRLILIEQVLPEGNEPSLGKFSDLIMMIMTGGRERTALEFGALFEQAGFRLERIVQTQSPMCLIQAVPV